MAGNKGECMSMSKGLLLGIACLVMLPASAYAQLDHRRRQGLVRRAARRDG